MTEPTNHTVQSITDNAQLSDQQKISAGICPSCDNNLNFSEGCKTCFSCGWSACG